jgi:hypothetical protein
MSISLWNVPDGFEQAQVQEGAGLGTPATYCGAPSSQTSALSCRHFAVLALGMQPDRGNSRLCCCETVIDVHCGPLH